MEGCLFLCLVALTAGAVSAQSSDKPLIVNGTLGGSVEFNLNITLPQNRQITWRTGAGSTLVARIINNESPRYGPSYENRCEVFPNGTLRLDRLTNDDQRLYAVTIEEVVSLAEQVLNYRLNVYTLLNAAELKITSSSIHFISGTNLTLHCDAGNQNVTTYTFYRDQKPICSEPHVTCRESFLDLIPITNNDSGSYTCTIQNPVSTNTSNSVNINIIVPISDIKVEVNNTGLIWPERDSVSLHCSAIGTNVSYSWTLDDKPLPEEPHYKLNENKSILIISPVSPKDNGSFTCNASNIISYKISNAIVLNLASLVSDVTLNSNASGPLWAEENSVRLHCSALGSAIKFSWSLNGKPLIMNDRYTIAASDSPPNSNLTINPVSRNDAGPFICTATNLASTKNSTATSLDLNWYPDGDISCQANLNKDKFNFICSWANGNPPANVTILFNGTTETLPNTVSKNVDVNAHIQGSNFSCSGEQLGRKSTCAVKLEPPQSSDHDNNTITTATAGKDVVFTVKLNSTSTSYKSGTIEALPAKFIWYRYDPDRTEIKSGGDFRVVSTNYSSNLNIINVTPASSGKYECNAINLVGNKIFIFNLNVTAIATSENGLGGGEIAGIVIGVLAGVTIIGIIVFFILKKEKKHADSSRLTNSDNQLDTVEYAVVEVNKQNGDVSETPITTNSSEDKDDLKYAVINFQNQPATNSATPTPVEPVYTDVKKSTKR